MTTEEKVAEMLESPIGRNWEGYPKRNWRVVSAACRHRPTGLLVVGARHFDKFMRAQIFSLQGYDKCRAASGDWKDMMSSDDWKDLDQGFIDNFGDFLTREEAWWLADFNDQIRHPEYGREGFLFSECLY